jgi:hypothetical protein
MASPIHAPTTTTSASNGASLRDMVNDLSVPYSRVVVSEEPSEVLLNVRLLIESARSLERDVVEMIATQAEAHGEGDEVPDAVPSRGDDVPPAPAESPLARSFGGSPGLGNGRTR